MVSIPVVGGRKDETILVSPHLFDVKASPALLSQYIRIYQANQKPSTAISQTRSAVSASRRKIYKQKGTGNARHGDVKAPIFVGGGTAHGPKNTKRLLKMSKQMRRKAFFYALTLKLSEKKIFALPDTLFAETTNTKGVYTTLVEKGKGIFELKRLLVLVPHGSPLKQNIRNVSEVDVHEVCDLNAYEVTRSRSLLFTEQSLEELHTQFRFKKNE